MGISIGALLAGGYGKGQRAGADAARERETQDAALARQARMDDLAEQKYREEMTWRKQRATVDDAQAQRAEDVSAFDRLINLRENGYVAPTDIAKSANDAAAPTNTMTGGMVLPTNLGRLAQLAKASKTDAYQMPTRNGLVSLIRDPEMTKEAVANRKVAEGERLRFDREKTLAEIRARADMDLEKQRQRGREKSPAQPKPVRPPTEAQEKSALFLGLMENALPTLTEMAPRIRPQMMSLIRKDPTKLLTIELTPDERRFWRAAREFTAAVLRKESGAAIQPFEIVDTIDRYIDAGFDDPATRADKAAARENYHRLLKRSARPALEYYGPDDTHAPPSSPTSSGVGDLLSTLPSAKPVPRRP